MLANVSQHHPPQKRFVSRHLSSCLLLAEGGRRMLSNCCQWKNLFWCGRTQRVTSEKNPRNASMLEAFEDFVKRQKNRLGIDPKKEAAN
ncbi:hypothetical protein [Bradyrhizobium sp. CCBAU 51753]|uniref:hypothetical protein n=1 Tax=Bradyrhizobium sp. CCBAU 51753 TaxID=1325100 RepID=UPI00188D2732|nr:hypothetical protein [Bradyrhizobium sp. CCBAU 51753]